MPDEEKGSKATIQPATTTSALTAAFVGLAALLPGKLAPAAVGMLAPFISQGLI